MSAKNERRVERLEEALNPEETPEFRARVERWRSWWRRIHEDEVERGVREDLDEGLLDSLARDCASKHAGVTDMLRSVVSDLERERPRREAEGS